MNEPQKEEPAQKDNPLERVFLANELLPNAAEAFCAQIEPAVSEFVTSKQGINTLQGWGEGTV